MMEPDDVVIFTERNTGKAVLEVGWRPRTNELLVNGSPVVTRGVLGLTRGQEWGAFVVVVATALGGLLALLQIIDWIRDKLV